MIQQTNQVFNEGYQRQPEKLVAVIMCGGKGTRLASVTGELPKAMVNIHNTDNIYHGQAKDTILEHQMKMLSENGVTDFILVVGNKKEFIKNAFTNETINQNIPGRDINISYFEESSPLGTGGAFCFKTLQNMIPSQDFLFIYSDTLFDVNVRDMYKFHQQENADMTVLISPCSEPDDRPLCVTEKGSNEIVSMIPKQGKGEGPRQGLFPNTPKNGLMIINKSVFRELPNNPSYIDMEEGILTKAIYDSDFKVSAWTTPCYVKDIGTVDRFYEGVKDLRLGIPQTKNPDKQEQTCVVFSENDLILIDENGNASVDVEIAQAISQLNESGIITLLNKDNKAVNIYEQEDMIVDTLLYRAGSGSYFNKKFDENNLEEFANLLEDWNIPHANTYLFARENEQSVIVNNLAKGDTTASSFMEATNMVISATQCQVQ